MEFKKEIEKLLFDLKSLGWSRKRIEEELKYNNNYISQALSRGGNESLCNNLKMLFERESLKSSKGSITKPAAPGDEFNRERALLKVLTQRVAKLEAERLGVPVEKVLGELEKDTMIAWRDLEQ